MKITSIFESIDGEVNKWGQGIWTTFVRFYGCSARCNYCDTKYSWAGNYEELDNSTVLDRIRFRPGKVTITGGEPFEQRADLFKLVERLLYYGGKFVSIETNGLHNPEKLREHLRLHRLPQSNLSIVMDYKLSSAGEHVTSKIRPRYYSHLTKNDYVKFVIQNKKDYDEAKYVLRTNLIKCKALTAFSPCKPLLPSELFNWMKEDSLTWITFNLQIHKYIFPVDDWRREEK